MEDHPEKGDQQGAKDPTRRQMLRETEGKPILEWQSGDVNWEQNGWRAARIAQSEKTRSFHNLNPKTRLSLLNYSTTPLLHLVSIVPITWVLFSQVTGILPGISNLSIYLLSFSCYYLYCQINISFLNFFRGD